MHREENSLFHNKGSMQQCTNLLPINRAACIVGMMWTLKDISHALYGVLLCCFRSKCVGAKKSILPTKITLILHQ